MENLQDGIGHVDCRIPWIGLIGNNKINFQIDSIIHHSKIARAGHISILIQHAYYDTGCQHGSGSVWIVIQLIKHGGKEFGRCVRPILNFVFCHVSVSSDDFKLEESIKGGGSLFVIVVLCLCIFNSGKESQPNEEEMARL